MEPQVIITPRPRRRQRRWVRWVRNIVIFKLTVGAVVIGAGAWLSYHAVPGSTVDYAGQLRALTLSRQPAGGDDGYPAFERARDIWLAAEARAMGEAGPQPADLGAREVWAVMPGQLDDPTMHPGVRKQTLAAIDYAEKAGLFRELDSVAAGARIVWPTPATPLLGALSTDMGRCRALLRVCRDRMHLAASRDDWEEFSRAFEQALSVGRVADSYGTMLSRLVATAVDAAAIGGLRNAIATRDVPEATLVRALRAMDAVSRPPFADAFESERLMMLDFVQRVYTDDGKGDGVMIPAKLRAFTFPGERPKTEHWNFSDSFAFRLPGKKAATAKVDELITIMKAHVEEPVSQRPPLKAWQEAWTDALPHGLTYIGVAAGPYDKAILANDQITTVWRGTRLLLGVEVYRRRHGRWPDALTELVPDILAEIPIDPFNEAGFRYVRLGPGESPDGAEYLLYTLGADGVDDDGETPDPEGAAFSSSRPAGDFRFNAPVK